MKKDTLIGLLRTLVGLVLLGYVIFLIYNQVDIIPTKEWGYDLTILIIIGLISLMMIFVGIAKPCFKKPRIMQAFMGIFLILFPAIVGIQDNPSNYVFLRDILQVIGALALALSFGKICVYDKCIQKKEQEEVEIIEV